MARSAQSAIKRLNAAVTPNGFVMRSVPYQRRCYFAALNKADRAGLNARQQIAHRCLWTQHAASNAGGLQ
jgi:hypothetical protein